MCHCTICSIARGGINETQSFQDPPSPRPQYSESTKSIGNKVKLCTSCYAILFRGKSYICSRSKKFQNMAALLSSSDSVSLDAEKFAAATISQKVSYKQGARAELTTPKNKSMVIKVNLSSSMVLLEGMSTIQNDLKRRMTNKLCKDLRQCSSSSIEPNIREKLHGLNHRLDDFFDVTEMNFEESDKRPVVICTDLNALIYHLFEQRGIANDSTVIIKFGIDLGGGYLKFCMNIICQSENVLNKCHHKMR